MDKKYNYQKAASIKNKKIIKKKKKKIKDKVLRFQCGVTPKKSIKQVKRE